MSSRENKNTLLNEGQMINWNKVGHYIVRNGVITSIKWQENQWVTGAYFTLLINVFWGAPCRITIHSLRLRYSSHLLEKRGPKTKRFFQPHGRVFSAGGYHLILRAWDEQAAETGASDN